MLWMAPNYYGRTMPNITFQFTGNLAHLFFFWSILKNLKILEKPFMMVTYYYFFK